MLRRYFHSGWAFLLPYLATYLLYAWLKWPVSPAAGGQQAAVSNHVSWAPCLVHVYWFLHGLHLLLGTLALHSWWRNSTESGPSYSILWHLVPWLCLALLFWIPGVYLEWPADPWEHLRRINEWNIDSLVTDHSVWKKSSYLLPYSLLSWCIGSRQLFWLDLYYTGICLLLCWQYYRLARACGLRERASTVFIVLQALMLGNSVFSFYRYYGISSSIYAQLGAIVLIRLAVVAVGQTREKWSSWPSIAFCGAAGLLFTAFNHPQAVGLAALGICGVFFWRLFDWRPAVGWIAVAILVCSILVTARSNATEILMPTTPALQDWISPWYGFKIFSASSPAAERMMQILGLVGLLNVGAALWLLRRNHLSAWLTLSPLLVLCLPYIAIPFARNLSRFTILEAYHRMYFAIPPGLALVGLLEGVFHKLRPSPASARLGQFGFVSLLAAISGLIALSPGRPAYNRAWNALSAVPKDLAMAGLLSAIDATSKAPPSPNTYSTGNQAAAVIQTFSPNFIASRYRSISLPAANSLQELMGIPGTTRATQGGPNPNLTRDPFAADPSAWRTFVGAGPQFVKGIDDFEICTTALQSFSGEPVEVFSAELIRVDPTKRYRLEISLKQENGDNGRALLAVAWYDKNGRLLDSGKPGPNGAANPQGWRNGTYSYFGPVDASVPKRWTTYRISFGASEAASIPKNASSLRVGALLNTGATPSTIVRLTNARLWEKSDSEQFFDGAFTGNENWLIVAPSSWSIYTPASQAAQLSRHWTPQQASFDSAGCPELEDTALRENATVEKPEGASFYYFAEKHGLSSLPKPRNGNLN